MDSQNTGIGLALLVELAAEMAKGAPHGSGGHPRSHTPLYTSCALPTRARCWRPVSSSLHRPWWRICSACTPYSCSTRAT
jgi:hypothetical protein